MDLHSLARQWFVGAKRIELQKLAVELGISRATAYRWAGSAEQLVGNVLASLVDETYKQIAQRASGAGSERALMVPFGVIVLYVLVDHEPEVLAAEENHPIEALGFDRFHETLGVRIQVRTLRGELDASNAGRRERHRKLCRVQRVTIMDKISFADEKPVKAVRQIPCNLVHPCSVRVRSNPCDLDTTSRKLDDEEHDVANETERCPHFHSEEIGRSKGIPMALDEFVPRGLIGSLRCRLDSVILEHPFDRCFADTVSQVC